MKSLSGLDATFLYLETPETPMHVGSLNLYELPAGFKGSFHKAVKIREQHEFSSVPTLMVFKGGQVQYQSQRGANERATSRAHRRIKSSARSHSGATGTPASWIRTATSPVMIHASVARVVSARAATDG